MNYLLSYPRSGNTWVRFIIEWFSDRPTSGIVGVGSHPADKPIHLRPKFKSVLANVSGDYIIEKAHTVEQVTNKKGKLVLLLRNPKEAIIRHENHIKNKNIKDYMSLISLYDEWDEQNRCLIYYEDLILEPKENIKKILNFLDISAGRLDSFMEKYNEHFNLSIKSYGAGSKTGGVKLVHHSKKINNKENNNFKKMIDDNHQHLKTYIKKFI